LEKDITALSQKVKNPFVYSNCLDFEGHFDKIIDYLNTFVARN